MNSRDVTPLSITALAIIAILILVLDVAGGDLLGRSQAHASIAAQDEEAKCPADAKPPVPDCRLTSRLARGRNSLPTLFAGSMLGIVAFRNINEVGFRRTILVLLLLSGASLALA